MWCLFILEFLAANNRNLNLLPTTNVAPAFVHHSVTHTKSYVGIDIARKDLHLKVEEISKHFRGEIHYDEDIPMKLCVNPKVVSRLINKMREEKLIRQTIFSQKGPDALHSKSCLSKLRSLNQNSALFSSAGERRTADKCSKKELVLLVKGSKAKAKGKHACIFNQEKGTGKVVYFDIPVKAKAYGITTKLIKRFVADPSTVVVYTTNKILEYKLHESGNYIPVSDLESIGGLKKSFYTDLLFDNLEDIVDDISLGCVEGR
ncbi:hypothetical protein Golomagni_05123 [Golovinomyces magnicellulatus]|nr:hypothetical protein Golomagni_05123 [Golovinomyces magnicellulatus]